MVNWRLVKSFKYMKTAPGVIFCRYAYTEKFKEIYIFAHSQPNHSHELLCAYDRRIPITAAKKDLRKLYAQQVIPPKVHDWFACLPTLKKARDRLSEPAAEDSGEDDD